MAKHKNYEMPTKQMAHFYIFATIKKEEKNG